jgi:hypothetical protein
VINGMIGIRPERFEIFYVQITGLAGHECCEHTVGYEICLFIMGVSCHERRASGYLIWKSLK